MASHTAAESSDLRAASTAIRSSGAMRFDFARASASRSRDARSAGGICLLLRAATMKKKVMGQQTCGSNIARRLQ